MAEITPEVVAGVVGILLSLTLSYVPGLRERWAALDADQQRGIVAALIVGSSVVIFALACTPSLNFPFAVCPAGGAWRLMSIIIAALVANQSAYAVTPLPTSVKEIRIKRG